MGFQTLVDAAGALGIHKERMSRIAKDDATLVERLALSAFIAGLEPWSPQIENQLLAQRELISSIRILFKREDYDEIAASQKPEPRTLSPTG